MALYKVEKSNEKKRMYYVTKEYLPCTVNYWERCKRESKKDKVKVRYIVKPKKKDIDSKVVNAIFEFSDGDVWYYSLLE